MSSVFFSRIRGAGDGRTPTRLRLCRAAVTAVYRGLLHLPDCGLARFLVAAGGRGADLGSARKSVKKTSARGVMDRCCKSYKRSLGTRKRPKSAPTAGRASLRTWTWKVEAGPPVVIRALRRRHLSPLQPSLKGYPGFSGNLLHCNIFG